MTRILSITSTKVENVFDVRNDNLDKLYGFVALVDYRLWRIN